MSTMNLQRNDCLTPNHFCYSYNAIYVASFLAFHTKVTVNIGLKKTIHSSFTTTTTVNKTLSNSRD